MPPRSRPKAPKKQLISRAALAREKGVSRAAVTQACRIDGPLSGAVNGALVDAGDPAVVAWLAEPTRGPDSAASSIAGPECAGPDPTKSEMLALTRRKREAECQRLEIANAVRLGELISWTLVTHHVFGAIESCFKRLLGDLPKTVTVRLFSMARSRDTSTEEGVKLVRAEISRHLKAMKVAAHRALQRDPRQDSVRSGAQRRRAKQPQKAAKR